MIKYEKKKWADTDPALIEIERQFTESLGTRVQISKTDYGGKLTIDYFSEEDLDKLLKLIQADGGMHGKNQPVQEMSEVQSEVETLSERTPLMSVEDTEETADYTEHIQEEEEYDIKNARVVVVTEFVSQVVPIDDEIVLKHKEEFEPFVTLKSVEDMQVNASEDIEKSENKIADEPFISPEEIKEKEDDDSDLYAIKNFGV